MPELIWISCSSTKNAYTLSGSVIFDFWGRAIGVLSAVSVGVSNVNPFPELVETAVHVQKIQHLDHKFIEEIFKDDQSGHL